VQGKKSAYRSDDRYDSGAIVLHAVWGWTAHGVYRSVYTIIWPQWSAHQITSYKTILPVRFLSLYAYPPRRGLQLPAVSSSAGAHLSQKLECRCKFYKETGHSRNTGTNNHYKDYSNVTYSSALIVKKNDPQRFPLFNKRLNIAVYYSLNTH